MADTQEFLDETIKLLQTETLEPVKRQILQTISADTATGLGLQAREKAKQAILQHFQQEQEAEPQNPPVKAGVEVKSVYSEDDSTDEIYCSTCGTCGFIGCCGVGRFLEKHVRGKTNCLNEDVVLEEIEIYCDREDKTYTQVEVDRLIREEKLEYAKYYRKMLSNNWSIADIKDIVNVDIDVLSKQEEGVHNSDQ